ncbi:MAG: ATP-binding cassette domain-containing protein [Desulfobacteraceae bacterium]|jgi:ABC-2 type transport system ATP-binding protein
MIHVENLTKFYDDFCAVDQINLDIEKGEIIGLLGPNGAGKTTTLRMLTGYFSPSAGDIRIKDLSVHKDPLAIKHLIGYLPESAPLYRGMLVYDYLDHVARIRGLNGDAKERRLRDLAKMCGLRGIMHKTIETLSKGLKQRVGLAHAMMSDPEILILDEPTSGLDPNQIVEIREIIRKIGEEKTVILSTHILSEAEATCDRIVIINKGRIIADGSTEEIKADNAQAGRIRMELVQADFDAVQSRLADIRGIENLEQAPGDDPSRLRIVIDASPHLDPRADIYAAVKETDWVLIDFHQESKTLESIFRELTQEN